MNKIKFDKKTLLKSAISRRAMQMAKQQSKNDFDKMVKHMKIFKALRSRLYKKFRAKAKESVKKEQ